MRRADGQWHECEVAALASYVSEEENPQNRKAVEWVEVFVPSPLFRHGLCLVDTPGLGSVWTMNTAATRKFIPHGREGRSLKSDRRQKAKKATTRSRYGDEGDRRREAA